MNLVFPTTVSPWLTFGVQSVTGLTTIVVAGIVAKISGRQWKTNQEKLRLDLYERRYAIYIKALTFRNDLIMWTGDEVQSKRARTFFKVYEEARFMFPPSSGVPAYLDEMNRHAYFIVKFKATVQGMESAPKQVVELSHERDQHLGWLVDSIPELIKRVGPSLNFHSV